jgi:hypothetical protein
VSYVDVPDGVYVRQVEPEMGRHITDVCAKAIGCAKDRPDFTFMQFNGFAVPVYATDDVETLRLRWVKEMRR